MQSYYEGLCPLLQAGDILVSNSFFVHNTFIFLLKVACEVKSGEAGAQLVTENT